MVSWLIYESLSLALPLFLSIFILIPFALLSSLKLEFLILLTNEGLLLFENKVIEPIFSVFFLFNIDYLFSIALIKKLKFCLISLLLL